MDSFASSPSKGIIRKARGKAGIADPRQLIADIPRICGRHPGIGHRGQIPIEVVRLGVGAKGGLLVIGVVAHGGERRGQVRPGECAVCLDPVPRRIIGVCERPQRRGPLLIREAREFGCGIVGVGDTVGVGEGETRTAVRIVVADRNRARALLHLRQAIGIVEGKGDLGLPYHGHGGTPGGIVIRIVNRPLRRDFLRQAIEPIIGSCDRRGDRSARIFFLHLRNPVPCVIGVVRRGTVLIGGGRIAVQCIVGVGRDLAFTVRDRGDIPVVIIGVGIGVE